MGCVLQIRVCALIIPQDVISSFDFTAEKVRLMDEKIAYHRDRLVSFIHDLFATKTNLKMLLDNFISVDKMVG